MAIYNYECVVRNLQQYLATKYLENDKALGPVILGLPPIFKAKGMASSCQVFCRKTHEIFLHCSCPIDITYTLKCLSIGTPKTINFPFVSHGKLMVLGVPIFKYIIMRL